VAALRSGLTPEVLRAWERRYRAVAPARSAAGQRLYSDADVEHLRLMGEATATGRRIGEIASLPVRQLQRLVAEDRAAPRPTADGAEASALLEECLAGAMALDIYSLEVALARALIALKAEAFADGVIAPLMRTIGERWARGEVTPVHEHLASAALRRVLGDVIRDLQSHAMGPMLVVATPSRQQHELGAMAAAVAASLAGWRVTYLGPDLPAADLAGAARDLQAAAVALSLTIAERDAVREVRLLRRLAGARVTILVGGRATARLNGQLERGGVIHVKDLASLRATLQTLADGAASPARGDARRP
jgi:DNA-binding transcriptional MerR regulator/methylmalonyl-CoA mutase cobalamin-binding subunit